MSSIKMKKVQKILTSFLNGAMKAGFWFLFEIRTDLIPFGKQAIL